MKFSYNWIKELVPDLTIEPRELMKLITIKTAECDGVEEAGAHFAKVVAARVLEAEPIPGSHNQKARIDAGPLGERTLASYAAADDALYIRTAQHLYKIKGDATKTAAK